MSNKYDVIVVGMGPSSIFCAYELIQLKKYKKVLTEKGCLWYSRRAMR